MSKEKLIAYFLLKLLRHAEEKTLATEITENKCRGKEFSSILISVVFCPAFPIREQLEPMRQCYDWGAQNHTRATPIRLVLVLPLPFKHTENPTARSSLASECAKLDLTSSPTVATGTCKYTCTKDLELMLFSRNRLKEHQLRKSHWYKRNTTLGFKVLGPLKWDWQKLWEGQSKSGISRRVSVKEFGFFLSFPC